MSIVGIIASGNQIVDNSFANIMFFSMILNFNLVFLNLLPIPPLDGSRILMDILSKINPRILRPYQVFYRVGFLLVMAVSLTLVARDISSIIT